MSSERFESWKEDLDRRAQESVDSSSSESIMNTLSKDAQKEQAMPKIKVTSIEPVNRIEHKNDRTFYDGVEPFSDIDTWAELDYNIGKSPEELAEGFIENEEREYKELRDTVNLYICKPKNGKLALRLVPPHGSNFEWYPARDPRSKQLLIEHYKKMEERKARAHKDSQKKKWMWWFK